MDTFIELLKSDKVMTAFTAVAASVATICAVIAIFQTKNTAKQELLHRRPYITVLSPGIEEFGEEHPYELHLTYENIGIHPAHDFKSKIYIFEEPFNKGPYHTINNSMKNDLPLGAKPTIREPITGFKSADVPTQYYIIHITYSDPILKKPFTQNFYFNWAGLKSGKGPSGFNPMTPERAEELTKFIDI